MTRFCLTTLIFVLFTASSVFAQIEQTAEEKLASFKSQTVKSDIKIGSIVEGSVDFGGIQPHYIIDYDDKAFTPLRTYAQSLREDTDVYKKIKLIKTYINESVFLHKDYEEKAYIKLLEKYKKAKKNIPLSTYLKGKAAVCREHALVFHMALKDAGVPNTYLYARFYQGSHVEDHAVNVVNLHGEMRVFDSYNYNFDDQPLNRLLDAAGKQTSRGQRIGIQVINEYPVVHYRTPSEIQNSAKAKAPFLQFLKNSRSKCSNGLKDLLGLMK